MTDVHYVAVALRRESRRDHRLGPRRRPPQLPRIECPWCRVACEERRQQEGEEAIDQYLQTVDEGAPGQ